jgi:hypothetical protein
LPECPAEHKNAVSLVLFYQYVEPMWSVRQHKKAMAFILKLGAEHSVTGRGRCALEGTKHNHNDHK